MMKVSAIISSRCLASASRKDLLMVQPSGSLAREVLVRSLWLLWRKQGTWLVEVVRYVCSRKRNRQDRKIMIEKNMAYPSPLLITSSLPSISPIAPAQSSLNSASVIPRLRF
jgi:hypothetical protein